MSLARELKRNKLNSVTQYSVDTEGWHASYRQFSVDAGEFIAKIKSQGVIAELGEADENIFHFLMSTEIYTHNDYDADRWHIAKKDMQGLLYSTGKDAKLPWGTFHKNYAEFKQAGKLKLVSDVAKENKKRIIEALLKFYAKDDDALMRVLLSQNINENTVLFVGYSSHIDTFMFDAVIDRVENLTPNQREQLLIARNQEGKTIMHAIAIHYANYDFAMYDGASVRKALCIADNNHDTPLHTVLATKTTKLALVKRFCNSAKLAQKEEKEFSLEKLFGRNLQGFNPLHFVCNRPKKSSDDSQLLSELLTILPKKLALDKIQEADDQDRMPLHHAIQSGQHGMAEILLDYLSSENKLTSKNPKKSLLHYACQYGNSHIINRVIEKLSQLELYQIQEELPTLEKLVSANSRVKQVLPSLINKLQGLKKTSNLFCVVKYLEHNYKDSTFTPKLADFCDCWSEIEAKALSKKSIQLPPIDPKLSGGLHISAFFKHTEPYYKLRDELSEITEQEAKEFRELIDTQSQLASENPQLTSPLVTIARQLTIIQTQRLPNGSLPRYEDYPLPKFTDGIPYSRPASPRRDGEPNPLTAMPVDATQIMPPTAQPVTVKKRW